MTDGVDDMADDRAFKCHSCGNEWHEPYGTGRPNACRCCGSPDIRRTDAGRGRRRAQGGPGAGPGQDER